ncbi:MAG: GNAT family protein [bacterium]|nr:GNAT family protein [bacterium]
MLHNQNGMFNFSIDRHSELRLFEPVHAEELNALVTDNFEHLYQLSAWLTDRERPVDRTREWINRNLEHFTSGSGYDVGIWHKGAIAGQIGYNHLESAIHKAEIGYWLGASFEGKGLITRSCRIMIDHAVRNLSINRIEIKCGTENLKSRKIPERLGFTEEGIARQAEWLHGRYIDLAVYSILSSEWEDGR